MRLRVASYKTHSLFNLLVAFPFCFAALIFIFHIDSRYILTFSLSFLFTTLFFGPDLDLAHQIKLKSVRGILSSPFRVYSKLFKHRGLSHVPIIGTLTRILFIFLFCLLLYFLCTFNFSCIETVSSFYKSHKPFFLFGFLGAAISDIFHIALDISWK